ncbi:LLM class flavin-dependent oxidoreductase [Actinocorallia lasiicapitis]
MGEIKIGVLLPTREMAMTGDYDVERLLSFARRAEAAGYDSLWTGDSLTARPRLDPFVVLSAVAAVTERITLGTAALTAALRHPLIGANLVAGLDHISGGRLELGLGAGFPIPESAAEFEAVGVPFGQRVGRLDETVHAWRLAWGTDEPIYRGRYGEIDGIDRLPPTVRPEGPRLWLAGSDTENVTARVARLYDGWLPFLPNPDAYEKAWTRIKEQAVAAGREPSSITAGMYATITVNNDAEAARHELENYVESYYARPLELMSTVQAYRYGTAETCASWLREYADAGANHFVLRIGSLSTDPPLEDILAAARTALA